MKVYLCKPVALRLADLAKPDEALRFSQWLNAASQMGWDLVESHETAPGTTVVVLSKNVPGTGSAPENGEPPAF